MVPLIVDKTGGVFYINTSGILANATSATLDLQSDLGITSSAGGGSISNAGTLTKAAGNAAAISSLVPVNFTNGATVDVAAGREVSFVGGGGFARHRHRNRCRRHARWRQLVLDRRYAGRQLAVARRHAEQRYAHKYRNLARDRATGNAVLNTATLANSGSLVFEKTGGVFYLNTSGLINNLSTGTLDLQSDGSTINSSTGGGSISNAGTLTKPRVHRRRSLHWCRSTSAMARPAALRRGAEILMQGGSSFAGTVNGTGVGATLDGGNWASTAGALTGNWQWRSGSLGSGTLTNSDRWPLPGLPATPSSSVRRSPTTVRC